MKVTPVTSNELQPGLMVLGMHRSGTSALAGILHLIGFNLGKRFIKFEPSVNEKGFWENKEANHFNHRLLRNLSSDWWDVFDLPKYWCEKSVKNGLDNELLSIVDRNFCGSTQWAVKDPRLCRLLPFWMRVFDEQGVTVKCMLILRHPHEVSMSLKERDGIELPHALLMWLRYVLDGELFSRSIPRVIITYDELLRDWEVVMGKVEEELSVRIQVKDGKVKGEINAFLDPRLRHHKSSSSTLDIPLLELANSAYEAVQQGDELALEKIRQIFEGEVKIAEPWLKQYGSLKEEFGVCREQCEKTHERLEDILNSRSWRWTTPLRTLSFKRNMKPSDDE